MRVLPVVPPFPESLRLGPAGAVAWSYHSIGLASIAAVVRQAGHLVRILECAGGGLSFGQAKQALRLFGPDLVGIQTLARSITPIRSTWRGAGRTAVLAGPRSVS